MQVRYTSSSVLHERLTKADDTKTCDCGLRNAPRLQRVQISRRVDASRYTMLKPVQQIGLNPVCFHLNVSHLAEIHHVSRSWTWSVWALKMRSGD